MRNGVQSSISGGQILSDLYQPLLTAFAGAVAKEVGKALEEKAPVRPRLLDAVQVGIIIGRTAGGVLQGYHKGQIPGFKFMGKIVFDEADIHKWIDSKKEL